MGMKRGSTVGRLVMVFEIVFPKTITDSQKEQIKNIL
jgi:DnaJ-class molecular chaperone